MLRYRSELLRIMDTFVFSPLLLFGFAEQKQMINLEFFTNYIDDSYNPATGIIVEVQSLNVQLYSIVLNIYAKFTGLRYFLYHWPTFSAFFGITTNLVMLLFIAILSWYQCLSTKKDNNQDNRYDTYDDLETMEERRTRIRKMIDKEKQDKSVSSSSKTLESDKPETIGGTTTDELLQDKSLDTDSMLRHRHTKHSSDEDHSL